MKILCVLYDDPKGGMPESYPLSDLPKIDKYPDGMTLPSPQGRDFTPGELLGCVSGELSQSMKNVGLVSKDGATVIHRLSTVPAKQRTSII